MASYKQATMWMEEGKSVFRESQPEHVYSFDGKRYQCSCRHKVIWEKDKSGEDDWKIWTMEFAKEEIAYTCPECNWGMKGNYCNACQIKWRFASCQNGVTEEEQ